MLFHVGSESEENRWYSANSGNGGGAGVDGGEGADDVDSNNEVVKNNGSMTASSVRLRGAATDRIKHEPRFRPRFKSVRALGT